MLDMKDPAGEIPEGILTSNLKAHLTIIQSMIETDFPNPNNSAPTHINLHPHTTISKTLTSPTERTVYEGWHLLKKLAIQESISTPKSNRDFQVSERSERAFMKTRANNPAKWLQT